MLVNCEILKDSAIMYFRVFPDCTSVLRKYAKVLRTCSPSITSERNRLLLESLQNFPTIVLRCRSSADFSLKNFLEYPSNFSSNLRKRNEILINPRE